MSAPGRVTVTYDEGVIAFDYEGEQPEPFTETYVAEESVKELVRAAQAALREMTNNKGHVRYTAQIKLRAALKALGRA